MNKGEQAGHSMAKSIVRFLHLMYQKDTALRVLRALIKELEKQKKSFTR